MKIAVTGANGAAGQAILRAVRSGDAASVEVVALVRSPRAAAALDPWRSPAVRVVAVDYDAPAPLRDALAGAAAVVHLAGVLVERPDARYETANVDTVRRVVESARATGVRRLVLVSAVGASPTSPNAYWRSKGLAERVAAGSGLAPTVLRVPLLLGPGTAGAAALRRQVGRRHLVLVAGGRTRQQPLDVDDLARAALTAARGAAGSRTLDLVGPVSLPERELVVRAARRLGREVRVHALPRRLLRLALALRARLAGPGLSPDVLDVLTTDTCLDPAPAAAALGLALTGLDRMLDRSLAAEVPA